MSRLIKLTFRNDYSTRNNTKIDLKQSRGTNTNSFTQSTASKKPTAKSAGNVHSSLAVGLSSISCNGSNTMSLSSTQTLAQNSEYTILVAWTNGDYTNDTWLISGTSNDAHWGIKAGGGDVIYKADGSKAAAGERDYPTDSTANSTTSYTFGSDVEVLAITLDGTGASTLCSVYNIDGDRIAVPSAVNTNGLSVAFPIDHVIGKSDGTLGLNGELLDIAVYDEVLSASLIEAYGNNFKQMKDF